MNLANSKVLVTGACGFIGSHVVEELVALGADVRAFVLYDRDSSWGWLDEVSAETKAAIEVVAGDVRDPGSVRRAMQGVDCVLHLAALIAIPYSYSSPESYVDTNVRGTLNVLEAARDLGVQRVVHTSTSEVYGTAQFVPITEEHPLNAQSPYAATKIAADQLALSYHASFETPVAVIRPFNTYGPRQSARAVIPTVIGQVAAGATSVKLGSTTPTRDFSFVTDTARGFLAVATSERALGQVTNLGSGFEVSIGDTVRIIGRQMGQELEIVTDEARVRPKASEVERLWAANDRARERCDWTPAYGGLDGFERGIAETAAWFSTPENLRRYKHDIYNV
ncbi:MAG: NAD-dependent 4,6-dehydratase LegB [Planctomycetota bacterium]